MFSRKKLADILGVCPESQRKYDSHFEKYAQEYAEGEKQGQLDRRSGEHQRFEDGNHSAYAQGYVTGWQDCQKTD